MADIEVMTVYYKVESKTIKKKPNKKKTPPVTVPKSQYL